jgi:hypothetical protein
LDLLQTLSPGQQWESFPNDLPISFVLKVLSFRHFV